MLNKDPSLLACAQYDGLNPRFEKMMVEAGVDVRSASSVPGMNLSPPVVMAGVVLTGILALAANGIAGGF